MAVFNKTTTADFASLVADFGQSVKVTRLGATVTSGMGAFVASRSADTVGSSLPGVSNTANTTKTLLLQGTVSKPPLVGDDLSCTQGTFSIVAVETVNPSGVVQLYKLELN